MRISTNTMFETGVGQLGTLQSQIARTQMQLSTNRRMLVPSDDPIASARALEVTQSQSVNTQFATNRQNARSSLSQVEVAMTSATSLLQEIQSLVVSAGNGTLSASDRATKANELSGRMDDLLGVANSADGVGGYLFSGYKSDTIPFSATAGGVAYNGDQGQRKLQVGPSRELAISASGSAIFMNNASGNGTFETAAAPANAGSGAISAGTVTAPAKVTRHDYRIDFQVAAGATTYSVTDTTSGSTVLPAPPATAPVPYVSGQAIAFDGIAFDVKGAPADGDSFSVEPSRKQSVFDTLGKLIDTLRLPASDAAGKAALSKGLADAGAQIDTALDTVLSVRATVGSGLKELDQLDSTGTDRDLQYSATLSELQDLDIVKAISDFTQQQMSLEAAQKSFKTLTGLSLFNYIG